MLELFKTTLKQKLSLDGSEKFLCAVSGGMDSMVMLSMMQSSVSSIGVCHIDHNTRDGQSTDDAEFVAEYCKNHGLSVYSKKVKLGDLSGNFQQAARDYRYAYLEEVCAKHGYDYILTAHHMDDRWESFIFNLSRSAGIDGLSTLRYQKGKVIRPLMLFTRSDIEKYAEEQDVQYVTDSSNSSDDYTRNRIRHHITPPAIELFPEIVRQANKSISYLDTDRMLLEELVERQSLKKTEGEVISIDLSEVDSYKCRDSLLFRLISQYGFSRSDVNDILRSQRTGSLYRTQSHEGLIDRGVLLVREAEIKEKIEIVISGFGEYKLTKRKHITISEKTTKKENEQHGLAARKLSFPFTIRNWKAGDIFCPSGMNGKSKKVKDFLTDTKLSRWEKEDVLVLEHKGKIVQVLGMRTAEGYEATKNEASVFVSCSVYIGSIT